MRLRTFTAPTMPEAMALVRRHLGGDAVILSTRRANGSVALTAALEEVPEGALAP
ncbi:MAG: GTP-binding protein, partial [Alphaproteobacteria bacterium]|nr:GTP-binding protein [Alphaproteobacteria bacterium]